MNADAADLLELGVNSELVENLSVAEAKDLLESLLYLREKYHVAVSSSA